LPEAPRLFEELFFGLAHPKSGDHVGQRIHAIRLRPSTSAMAPMVSDLLVFGGRPPLARVLKLIHADYFSSSSGIRYL
jgi:hypothetical protein